MTRAWILPGDAAGAQAIYCNEDAQRYYVRGTLNEADVPSYLARLVATEEQAGFGVWPVIEKSSRELVGACGLSRVADLAGEVEIEWVFKESARGKGYAKEVARAVLHYAFGHMHLTRVCALVDRENAASIAIINRLGLRFQGIVRAYNRDLMQYVTTPPAGLNRA
ncbi:MAG: GNAT family N-acetyltransferase [Candidatus Eremiobacteraeota bacterium]|nr:GNAT family N-acetyltransferase [Candidatus Eremiobacteraeota bacterium]